MSELVVSFVRVESCDVIVVGFNVVCVGDEVC